MSQGALRPSGKSRNSSPYLVSQIGSTNSSLHPVALNHPVDFETMPLFRTFPPKFLHGAATRRSGGTISLVDRACRSSASTLNKQLIRMDPVLESPCSAANCRVHADRVLDTRVKTSGSE